MDWNTHVQKLKLIFHAKILIKNDGHCGDKSCSLCPLRAESDGRCLRFKGFNKTNHTTVVLLAEYYLKEMEEKK